MTELVIQPRESIDTPQIGLFEKWLTIWVFLCIVTGITLGQLFSGLFKAINRTCSQIQTAL